MRAEFKSRELYPVHPIARIAPEMPEEQFEAFKGDVEANGQKEAITLFEDMILDGRARQRACQELGIPARYKVYKAQDTLDAWRHAQSLNLHRQHARAETRVACLLRAADRLPEVKGMLDRVHDEARERRNSRLKQYRTQSASEEHRQPHEEANGKSAVLVGLLAGGASRATVERVLAVKRHNFRLFNMVADGKISAGQAIKGITRANRTFIQMQGRYRVFYADPPWPYGTGTSIEHDPTLHYKTMTLKAICDMPVRDHANKHAALFLWATSFFLSRALEVAHAWGFEYRSNIVWQKRPRQGAGIVTGGWSKMQHEHLLICTRGRVEPDVKVCEPSVQEFPVAGHSVKPPYFRGLIDRMFPTGRRAELFAREQVDGWDCYGDEL